MPIIVKSQNKCLKKYINKIYVYIYISRAIKYNKFNKIVTQLHDFSINKEN